MKKIRWKPKYGEQYYYVGMIGMTYRGYWTNQISNEAIYRFGNCFRTRKEAVSMAKKIKDLLRRGG